MRREENKTNTNLKNPILNEPEKTTLNHAKGSNAMKES